MFSFKNLFLYILILFSNACLAGIPAVNLYNVEKRYFSSEPTIKQLNINIKDSAILNIPTIAIYTQLNPLKPDAVYTVRPYPDTHALPKIGKWMITSGNDRLKIKNIVPAHWVAITNIRNQYIIEPINYLFIVYANDSEEAIEKINSTTHKIGFLGTASDDHTNGYFALIGNRYLSQLKNKAGQFLTFSNGDFRVQNDHFRTFGAFPLMINRERTFLFIASVSEESGIKPEWAKYSSDKLKSLAKRIMEEDDKAGCPANYGHRFVSFSNARNNLAVALIQSGYPTYFAILNNILRTSIESTEDHDGNIFITIIK